MADNNDLLLGVIVKVPQSLLEEGARGIRDIRMIAESLAVHGGRSQGPDVLTASAGGWNVQLPINQ